MLPPGHLAAGYITAKIVTSSLHYNLTSHQVNVLTLLGTIIAFIPDLDFFIAFAKTRSFRIENDKVIHRKFWSHAPLLWLAAGLLVFFLAQSPFYKALGLLIWLCSWIHFICDTEWGIMWLWPFSKKFYPFSERFYAQKYKEDAPKRAGFFTYWFDVIWNEYTKRHGYIEIILIIAAAIIAAH